MLIKIPHLLTASIFITINVQNALARQALTVGALGDSITAAMNTSSWGDQPQDSWSTGTNKRVMSHAVRLQDKGMEVQTYNYSRSGAVSSELPGQVDKLLSKNPDYVTLLLGANDVCQWPDSYETELAEFSNNIEQAIKRLTDANQELRLLLIPLPDMWQLWNVAKDMGRCSFKWRVMRICPQLLGNSRTDEQRLTFRTKLMAANEALQKIADKYPEQVRFDISLFDVQFERQHVSTLDCFHPSQEGQALISEKTWQEDWF